MQIENGTYANLLGKWVHLGGSDEIEDKSADDWASENLGPRAPLIDRYLKIRRDNVFYVIHPSQIILVDKK